jgi:hypothetical protein
MRIKYGSLRQISKPSLRILKEKPHLSFITAEDAELARPLTTVYMQIPAKMNWPHSKCPDLKGTLFQ